ncbi:MAG TPA: hypothetical protein EYP07_14820 [Kiloniellaceae bacterium]|nr:hypothetical protein [Kiloniellaceae bacterium]
MALSHSETPGAEAQGSKVISFAEACEKRALRAGLRRILGEQAGAALIADCGRPNWPGWQFLILLLLTLQLALAAQQALGDPVPEQRLARTGAANAVRVVRITRTTRRQAR